MTGLTEIVEEDGKRKVRYHFHDGQYRAWVSDRRFILVLAGVQSGKTEAGPPWLWREIQRCGPGDYLAVSPTYTLMGRKLLPAFLKFFRDQLRLGQYLSSPTPKFTLSSAGNVAAFGREESEQTTIFFGHAGNPESLESATVKAAWLDEVGQKQFKLESWEAIQRRLAINKGRCLLTTSPYNLGWLKQKVYDPWKESSGNHPNIEVVHFESIANPVFPREEYERAKRELPAWKFNLFYRGYFTRPAGLIYDAFNEGIHRIKRFRINPAWPRYLGLDFGGVNTAAVYLAKDPASKRFYLYREYKAGNRSVAEHVKAILHGETSPVTRQNFRFSAVGGSQSEGQWRTEFRVAGLTVQPPDIKDVEVGIERVYGSFRRDELFVFDDLPMVLEELGTYTRELDSSGEPTEKIEDKETFHLLDALRYIMGWVNSSQAHTGRPFQAAAGMRGIRG